MWNFQRVYHGEVLCNWTYSSSAVQVVLIDLTLFAD